MTKRIFIATKRDLNLGAICDVEAKTANGMKCKYNSEQVGLSGTREVALYGLIEAIKSVDVKGADVPNQYFVVSSLFNIIDKQTYKYWILRGKNSKGEDIVPSELKLWKEFDKLMSKKGLYVVVKNLADANFRGTPKFNQAEIKYNKFYHDWVWNTIHAIYPQGPAVPSEPGEEVV